MKSLRRGIESIMDGIASIGAGIASIATAAFSDTPTITIRETVNRRQSSYDRNWQTTEDSMDAAFRCVDDVFNDVDEMFSTYDDIFHSNTPEALEAARDRLVKTRANIDKTMRDIRTKVGKL